MKPAAASLTLLGLALVLTLSGCSKGPVGVYSGGDSLLKMTVDLKPSGRAYVTTMAGTTQGDYSMDGDKVVIKMDKSNIVFTLTPEGTLKDGPFGIVLKKQE
jgi:hypothetical protein